MARTYKARTQAVDNQGPGGGADRVTSQERTINGSLPPSTSTWGNSEKIAVGVAYGADENIVVTATNLLLTERLTP
jgi:hypothetical protein